MCKGLVVGEITSSNGAITSVWLQRVPMPICREKKRERNACLDFQYAWFVMFVGSNSTARNPKEPVALTTNFNPMNSFEALDYPRLSNSERPSEAFLLGARLKPVNPTGKGGETK